MRRCPDDPPSIAILGLILAAMVFALVDWGVYNFDIWWHLKTGWLIWQEGTVPTADPFSYTAAGAPWFNHEWGFQVVAWPIYALLGEAGLTLVKLALTGLIAAALFRTIRLLTNSPAAALAGTLLVLWGMADRVMARPFLVTLALLALFAAILHRATRERTRWLWALPPLALLWSNMHGGGILAPALVGAVALGEEFQSRLHRDRPLAWPDRRRLWIITGLTTLALLLSPYGEEAVGFTLFEHLRMTAVLQYTQEWLPLLDSRLNHLLPILLARACLLLVPIAYLLNRKRFRFSHLLLTLLSFVLIAHGKRFVPHLLIINVPILFFNLRPLAARVAGDAHRRVAGAWITTVAAALLVIAFNLFGVPLTVEGQTLHESSLCGKEVFQPKALVDFLDRYDLHGRAFNDMAMGGYLIFRRWPGDRVFLDGRTPVYGDDFYRRFVNAINIPTSFATLDDEYDFDLLLFQAAAAWEQRALHAALAENPDWHLVFFRCEGLVYIKERPGNRALIEKLRITPHPIVEAMKRKQSS